MIELEINILLLLQETEYNMYLLNILGELYDLQTYIYIEREMYKCFIYAVTPRFTVALISDIDTVFT